MSYCRFSSGDVYMFHHVCGFVECCSCLLAPKVKTIFTRGYKGFLKECETCKGKGCKECNCKKCNGEGGDCCMMHGNSNFDTFQEAYNHLLEHKQKGHSIPEEAFEELQKDINSGKSPKDNLLPLWNDGENK